MGSVVLAYRLSKRHPLPVTLYSARDGGRGLGFPAGDDNDDDESVPDDNGDSESCSADGVLDTPATSSYTRCARQRLTVNTL